MPLRLKRIAVNGKKYVNQMLWVEKGFKGKKPCTTCRATDTGVKAFNEYVDALKDCLSLQDRR